MALIRKNYHLDNKDLTELKNLNKKLGTKKSMAFHIRTAIKEYNKRLRRRLES